MKRNVRNKKGDTQTAANNNDIKMYENYLGRSVVSDVIRTYDVIRMYLQANITVRRGFCSKGHFGQRYLVQERDWNRISIRHKNLFGGNSILKVLVWKRKKRGFLHFVDYFKVKPENGQRKCTWERRSICGKEEN